MRKVDFDIKSVIEEIKRLKGESVNMEIAKGRNRIEKYTGVIESVYPSIFTVKVDDDKNQLSVSYSYSDVLCGDVVIQKR